MIKGRGYYFKFYIKNGELTFYITQDGSLNILHYTRRVNSHFALQKKGQLTFYITQEGYISQIHLNLAPIIR